MIKRERMEMSQWLIIASQAYELGQQRKKLEQEEKKLRDQLMVLSEGKTRAEGGYIFIKEVKKGNIEYSKIPLLSSMDLEIYRKPDVEAWKLVMIGE